ncbi:MSMEG_1061 family FMN-dependent PPOX-type flavoprotein [Streptomyces sp. PpalLS-921]|uniref:MSMEG_1061 family FMN-dependent PPOX-type flavoprotein n=1 Tax=Streptomyces sp. PpalLS-921 TaxID=1839772 RepID=UPI00081D75D8|nr:MSMEG_1061 family FMN-dependent PPOX-type flavoprotein [Streptomyces sp. PpalLS-921]SCD47414.1 hypothetical protein GA0115249_10468 [Streptomyces sp. PpalLS-921]
MSNAAPAGAAVTAPAGDPLAGAVPLESAEELREIMGTPWPLVIDKVHDRLTEADLDLLARAPFCAVSTSDADGNCDTSPRGGEPGFTRVLDARTLAMPDLPGNRRADSFQNILSNPHVGLLFLIPGVMTVLRINGRARILTDAPFFDAMAVVKGRRPHLALVVEIDEIYLHCPASLKRSGLWAPDTWEGAPRSGAGPA